MRIKELRERKDVFAPTGLTAVVLGVSAAHVHSGMKLGCPKTNQEIKQVLKEAYDGFKISPKARMQY